MQYLSKFALILLAPCRCQLNFSSGITDLCDAPDSINERKNYVHQSAQGVVSTCLSIIATVGHYAFVFFVTHAVLQTACCFPSRSGNVSYHSDYFGTLLRD